MLYYPHYTPSKHQLRSILLFSDDVNLIVPEVDQGGVEQRGNVRDIFLKRPELIKFKDPHYRYDSWANKPKMDLVIQSLLKEASDQIQLAGYQTLKTDKYGNLQNGQEVQVEVLRTNFGWKYVAAEKFPHQIHRAVFDSKCAARAGPYVDKKTGNTVEHNGVICHPMLADFILCRMAREASFKEATPSITFGGMDFMNHLLDGEQPLNSPEQALMQASLDLFVPDNLLTLDIDEFISVRNDYAQLRQSVRSYLNSMAVAENLNMASADQDALLKRLASTRKKIKLEMEEVAETIGRQRFMSQVAFAVEAAATFAGPTLGAFFSGTPGALVGAGLGFAGGKFAHKLSTIGNSNGQLSSVAMTKAKIERLGLQKRWNAPSFWSN